jgi:hypothetical protein
MKGKTLHIEGSTGEGNWQETKSEQKGISSNGEIKFFTFLVFDNCIASVVVTYDEPEIKIVIKKPITDETVYSWHG